MSRTRNTRPIRARPESWVEYHDHKKGVVCDIVPLAEYLRLPRQQQWRTRCSWSLEWYTMGDTRCSCESCRNGSENRRKNKKLRQAVKLLIKQADPD